MVASPRSPFELCPQNLLGPLFPIPSSLLTVQSWLHPARHGDCWLLGMPKYDITRFCQVCYCWWWQTPPSITKDDLLTFLACVMPSFQRAKRRLLAIKSSLNLCTSRPPTMAGPLADRDRPAADSWAGVRLEFGDPNRPIPICNSQQCVNEVCECLIQLNGKHNSSNLHGVEITSTEFNK